MKANELRIENWVNHDGRLISIELKHFQDILLYPNEQRKYAPIPLTEEWLLKFGFKKENNFTWGNLEMELMQREDGFWIWLGADLYLKHVHQLQNLYHALTRKELTIKQNDEK